MREFMRNRAFNLQCLFIGILVLQLSGCRRDPGMYLGPSSAMADAPPSPELMQYAEDLGGSFHVRATARTWKTEIDDVRDGKPVHIVTEAACPDRYHVFITGAQSMNTYYIGHTMYERKGDGPWTQKQILTDLVHLGPCRIRGVPENVDPARIRMLAESLRGLDLSRPELRDINGRKCRFWDIKDPEGRAKYATSSCFDVQTHELVQSVYGTISTHYYWNVPLEIKAPI